MQIIFFCPPVTILNGGMRTIFRMAEVLCAAGHEAIVFEEKGRRPGWFRSTAPIAGQGVFDPRADQILVLPEDQPHILATFANWTQRKVVYSQNHFYGALGIGEAESYADYGVTHILCSSMTIYNHAKLRHPKVTPFFIPCPVDGSIFKPARKEKKIAFMPRKRGIEATYIRDMFRFTFPAHRDWTWELIRDKTEAEVAALLGEAEVFLSLSRLEGFGLTPLEAMAADCVVAGFTGGGGRDYATAENGFWADEDDFEACVAGLGKAAALAAEGGDDPARVAYRAACRTTLQAYTPARFEDAVKDAWAAILGKN